MKTETTDISHCEVHSDAGGNGVEIECPNCGTRVVFAPHQWWESDCKCGTWELKATLEPGEWYGNSEYGNN